MKVMIDFDGVIHSFKSGYTGLKPEDDPVVGARGFIEFLLDKGHEPVIFTSRMVPYDKNSVKQSILINEWLKKHNFPKVRVTAIKEPADLYIDDRGYRFTGHFRELRDWIIKGNIDPYHKKGVY